VVAPGQHEKDLLKSGQEKGPRLLVSSGHSEAKLKEGKVTLFFSGEISAEPLSGEKHKGRRRNQSKRGSKLNPKYGRGLFDRTSEDEMFK